MYINQDHSYHSPLPDYIPSPRSNKSITGSSSSRQRRILDVGSSINFNEENHQKKYFKENENFENLQNEFDGNSSQRKYTSHA